VNRPFYAVGMLLAVLGAALVAVQATSQRPVPQPAASSSAEAAPPESESDRGAARATRGGVFVFVLSAGEPSEVLAHWPSYEDGCGLDRSTGEIYPLPDSSGTVAEAPLTTDDETADGRTHYDPAYDAAVFGLAAVRRDRRLPTIDPGAELLDQLDPAKRLKRDLIRGQAIPPRRPKVRRDRLAEAFQPAQPVKAPIAQAPTWEDYEEWIASTQGVVELHGSVANSTDPPMPSGRWVRQIAAQALSQLADLLQSTASELERSAAEELAKRRSSSIPK
jgi:hypothetical protein